MTAGHHEVSRHSRHLASEVGDYRILLDIDDGTKTVLILRIAHRRDVYR
ncbi:MAG: type II toxin-antitoxin system RelE/ParE family toxin [Nitrospira sp.]|nr:type II toxin-antitoxin system RelE/ParE family toxin [Nitrospira sp.]MDI3462978.1 hypothetical protein [Nitrospira sp.]